MKKKEHGQPGFVAFLPANVRYDKRLKPMEKLMFAEISCLANARKYCFATNAYFGRVFEVHKNTAGAWIKHLEKLGYIRIKLIYKENSKQILQRRIYMILDNNTGEEMIDDPTNEMIDSINEKIDTPINEKIDTPINEKIEDNNTSINNTSINKKINKKNPRQANIDAVETSSLSPARKEKLKEWIDYRFDEIKKPLKTTRAIKTIINSKWIQESNAVEFIEHCMNHEWQGLEQKIYDDVSKSIKKPVVEERVYTDWILD